MKAFFEEYGLLIVVALVVVALIGITTVTADGMGTQIGSLVTAFGEKVANALDVA